MNTTNSQMPLQNIIYISIKVRVVHHSELNWIMFISKENAIIAILIINVRNIEF